MGNEGKKFGKRQRWNFVQDNKKDFSHGEAEDVVTGVPPSFIGGLKRGGG